MRPPSIKDIASATGLSVATISKYLNEKPIRKENKEKIEQAIRQLGYVPNRNAQMLRSSKSHTIGLIISDISNAFWGSIIDYMETHLQSHGYMTIIYSGKEFKESRGNLAFIAAQNPDGIIITPDDQFDIATATYFSQQDIPVVVIDQCLQETSTSFDTVTSDNFAGGYLATRHLIEKGHRKIGIIGGRQQAYTASERMRGILAAMQESDIALEERYCSHGDFTSISGQLQFRSLMQLPDPPDAIFATNLDVGIGALLEANSEGFRIGKDISFISFDDDEIFSGSTPPVTVVSQDVGQLGTQAAALILKRITGHTEQERRTIKTIPVHLVIRNSVADMKKRG